MSMAETKTEWLRASVRIASMVPLGAPCNISHFIGQIPSCGVLMIKDIKLKTCSVLLQANDRKHEGRGPHFWGCLDLKI